MKRIIFISLIVISLLICSQGVVVAKATKIAVLWDAFAIPLEPIEPPQLWFDEAGNVHFHEFDVGGDFNVVSTNSGATLDFHGYRIVEVYGQRRLIDGYYRGYIHGPVTVYEEQGGDVAFVGHMHAYTEQSESGHFFADGEIILHGVGVYKGIQLKLDVGQDSPIHYLGAGQLLNAHGE